MIAAKWGVNYSTDTLSLPDILHFAPLARDAGADVLWTAEGWRTHSSLFVRSLA